MLKHTLPLALVATILSGSVSVAQAQTTINLKYDTTHTCVFTTDGLGVSLDGSTGSVYATGSFGAGCPSGQTNPAPTISSVQANPASPAVNTPFTASFTSTNAARCTTEGSSIPGGATLTGWPASTANLCTGSACNSFSTSLSASATGNYTLAAKCYNADGVSTASAPTTVVVQTVSTSCAASGVTRQGTGRVVYYPGGNVRNNVVFTDYYAIFGYDQATGVTTTTWPGVQSGVTAPSLQKTQYMSLPFTVPANVSSTMQGTWALASTGSTSTVSFTVSDCEGDFSSPSIGTYCKVDNKGEGFGIAWAISNSPFTCKLNPGQKYYLNFVNANLATPGTSTCSGTTCSFGITNTVSHP